MTLVRRTESATQGSIQQEM